MPAGRQAWEGGPGISGGGAIAVQPRGGAIRGRRIGAVGLLAALLFAVTFAIGAATKTHSGGQTVAQPAPATSVFNSTPVPISAGFVTPAVPPLKHVRVRKPPTPAAPVQAAPTAPPTTVVPTAPTQVGPSPPSQSPNSGFIGGGSFGGSGFAGGGSSGG